MLDAKWVYGIGVLVVSGALYWFWPQYRELQPDQRKMSRLDWALSIAVGLVVFELWINLTEPWMILGSPTATFRPVNEDGSLQWGLILFRWVGAALMVPVMEELFWRSFLMRWSITRTSSRSPRKRHRSRPLPCRRLFHFGPLWLELRLWRASLCLVVVQANGLAVGLWSHMP